MIFEYDELMQAIAELREQALDVTDDMVPDVATSPLMVVHYATQQLMALRAENARLRAACKSAFVTLREQPIGRAIDAETMEMSGPQLVIWQAYTVLRDALEGSE